MRLAPTGFSAILPRRGPQAQEPDAQEPDAQEPDAGKAAAPRRFAPDPARDAQWNRGAYLAEHLGHRGACHTPRGFLGAKVEGRKLAGNPKGPDGKKVPNITPDPEDGIGRWRAGDVTDYLKTGFRPDGDVAGGAMSGVIEDATAHLGDADRARSRPTCRAFRRSRDSDPERSRSGGDIKFSIVP